MDISSHFSASNFERVRSRPAWTGTPMYTGSKVMYRTRSTHLSSHVSTNLMYSTTAQPFFGHYDKATSAYFLVRSGFLYTGSAPLAVAALNAMACSSTDGQTWTNRTGGGSTPGTPYFSMPVGGVPYMRCANGIHKGSDAVGTTLTFVASTAPTYLCRPVLFNGQWIIGKMTGVTGNTPLGIENTTSGTQTAVAAIPTSAAYLAHAASNDKLVLVMRKTVTTGMVVYYTNTAMTAWTKSKINYGKFQDVDVNGYSDGMHPLEVVWTGTRWLLFVAVEHTCSITSTAANLVTDKIVVFSSTDAATFDYLSEIKVSDYDINLNSNGDTNISMKTFTKAHFSFGGARSAYRNSTAAVSNGRIALGASIQLTVRTGTSASDSQYYNGIPCLLYSMDEGKTWNCTDEHASIFNTSANTQINIAFTELFATPDGFMGFYTCAGNTLAFIGYRYFVTDPNCQEKVVMRY
jgi:hypothetical protein